MAIVFRSLILFLTVLQSFTFGRYPPLPPSLEKNSNGKSGISLPLTVCIVQVQNIYIYMSGFKQTRQDHLRHGVLSAYLSHNYAKGNFKNSYTKTSGISCNKLHGPDTLKRNIFQRQSSQLSADLKALVPNSFLINHSIFPFQIFISL